MFAICEHRGLPIDPPPLTGAEVTWRGAPPELLPRRAAFPLFATLQVSIAAKFLLMASSRL